MNPYALGIQKTAGTKHIGSASATGEIPAYQRRTVINPDLGAITLTMPDPAMAPGMIFVVLVPDVDTAAPGATTVATLVAKGLSNMALDADGDHVVLWSDGEVYHRLINGIA